MGEDSGQYAGCAVYSSQPCLTLERSNRVRVAADGRQHSGNVLVCAT